MGKTMDSNRYFPFFPGLPWVGDLSERRGRIFILTVKFTFLVVIYSIKFTFFKFIG